MLVYKKLYVNLLSACKVTKKSKNMDELAVS